MTPITTLSTALTSGTSTTSLVVSGLTQAVASGDSLTIGSGSQAQIVTASAATAVGTGSQTISVRPRSNRCVTSSFAAGTAIADAAWGGTTVYNPDQNGCVYLQEPLGKYSVSLASPSGGPTFIDYQEYSTPGVTGQNPVTVTVSTSGLEAVPVQFHYDEAGTVSFTPSAAAPIATGMPVSVGNSSLQPSGTNVIVAHGSSATTAQLFPYTTGYTIWYRGLHDPGLGHQGAAHRGGTTFALSPQGTATAQITGLDTLKLAVTQTGGEVQGPHGDGHGGRPQCGDRLGARPPTVRCTP